MMSLKVFFLVIALESCSGAILSFIHPCSISDSQCLAREATSTLRNLRSGNSELHIASLEPLYYESVKFDGGQIGIKLNKIEVHGLTDADIRAISFDTAARKCEIVFFFPNVQIIGDYEVNGKVLTLTLTGHGRENLTSVDTLVTWNFQYDLQDRGGKKYMKIIRDDTQYKIGKLYLQLDDLFSGDEVLTKSTNELLNAEWQDVVADIGPGIQTIIGNSIRMVVDHLFDTYSFDELILL